jgi:iron complex transport system substrate-binding protein
LNRPAKPWGLLRASSLRILSFALAAGVCAGCRGERPVSAAGGVPRRIVALAPNLTEIVFALQAGDRLVGVSEYSDYPEAARTIPRVGGLEVDPEKVVALRPDLVLAVAEGSARGSVRALEAAGLPVLVVPSGSLDAVLESVRLVADRLGRADAGAILIAQLSREREAARRRAASRAAAGRPRVKALLLVWPDPPQAAGRGTFLDDLLTEAGAENVAGHLNGWPVLSREFLATSEIDLLVIPDAEATRAAWRRAFADGPLSRGSVARARVIRLDESALTRPGPRVFAELERLADALP